MGFPSANARFSDLSTTIPPPSPRTKPFARASNAHNWLVGEMPPNLEEATAVSGLMLIFTPPARARVASPACRERQAICTLTREEEHAVSRAMLGPCKPSAYEIRLATMLKA